MLIFEMEVWCIGFIKISYFVLDEFNYMSENDLFDFEGIEFVVWFLGVFLK